LYRGPERGESPAADCVGDILLEGKQGTIQFLISREHILLPSDRRITLLLNTDEVHSAPQGRQRPEARGISQNREAGSRDRICDRHGGGGHRLAVGCYVAAKGHFGNGFLAGGKLCLLGPRASLRAQSKDHYGAQQARRRRGSKSAEDSAKPGHPRHESFQGAAPAGLFH
jgi:hypothetical protein